MFCLYQPAHLNILNLLYLCFALSITYLPCTSYFFSKKWADTVAITATNHQCLMCFFHFKEKTHLFFSWIHGSPSSCGLEPNLHIAKLLWMETQSSINVVWSLGRTYPQNEVSLVLLSHTKKNIVSSILMKYTTDVELPFVILSLWRKGWLLWITDGRAKPLMDWKVIDLSHSFSLSFALISDYLPSYLAS